jgi:hypothetical protein
MENILTTDEKKYLNRVCNYLGSLGMKDGLIEFELESEAYAFSAQEVQWKYITHFANNYSADIPDGLIPILKKLINHVDEDNLFTVPDVDMMNYQKLEINIDVDDKEISISHYWGYYDRGNENVIDFDSTDDKERFKEWDNEGLFSDVEVPNDGILELQYNGSGDSGYIESSFEPTNDAVPAHIEDWCYRVLEDNFGGWEINEGSDGKFVFNFNDGTVTLYHTMNVEEDAMDTLYEESFAL